MAGATALFLTHRQGTAIAIWNLEEFVAGIQAHQAVVGDNGSAMQLVAPWLDEARRYGAAIPSEWSPSSPQASLLASAIHFLKGLSATGGADAALDMPQLTGGLGIWLSSQPTAETLWLHFRELSRLLGLNAGDLQQIVFGGGPVGSFTGLRLGAAFAGGLAMGRGMDLFAVPTFEVPTFEASTFEASVRFAKQAIHPIEVFAAMASVLAGGALLAKAESLHYASEPGPVLTLQSVQSVQSSQRVQNKGKP
jgi:hypothetical protein